MNKIKLNKLLHSIDKLESVDSIFIHEKKIELYAYERGTFTCFRFESKE